MDETSRISPSNRPKCNPERGLIVVGGISLLEINIIERPEDRYMEILD